MYIEYAFNFYKNHIINKEKFELMTKYNFTMNGCVHSSDWELFCALLLNKNPEKYITFTKDRLYNDKRYSVSSKKIRKLGWKPKRNLLEDLPMIIKWYQKNYKIFKKI